MSTQTQPPLIQPAPESAAAPATEQPPIPKWVGVMVAVAIFGSMVGGGGLWAWSYYTRPDPKNLVEVGAPSSLLSRSVVSAPRPPAFPFIANGITQTSPINYQLNTPDFTMLATKVGTDWNVRLIYSKPDLLTADQKAALIARQRLGMDPLFAKSLKVSDEQVAKIKAVPFLSPSNLTLTLSPADLDKIKKTWSGFISVTPPKAADAPALLNTVQEIGKANLATTRKTVADISQQVQEILTPEQLAAFKQ